MSVKKVKRTIEVDDAKLYVCDACQAEGEAIPALDNAPPVGWAFWAMRIELPPLASRPPFGPMRHLCPACAAARLPAVGT